MGDFDLGQSAENGFTKVFEFLPQVIGALLLLVVGYFIAKIIQRLARRVLVKLRFDHAVTVSPAGTMLSRMIDHPSRFVAKGVFWFVWIGFISLAVSALNIPALTAFVAAIYGYLPNVLAAMVIFLVASAISAGTAAFIKRVMGNSPTAKILMTVGPSLTMSIAIFMILNQLGIARDIVNITYVAIMGSLSLGLALAFGLGGRDIAARMLDQAYEASRDKFSASEIRRGTRNAKTMARQAADQVK